MTLIASYITKFGIIQASDSNLTTDTGNYGFGQKIFPIPHLNASLAYSGSYYINGNIIDQWMNEFITGSYFTAESISEFTEQLTARMSTEMREEELSKISIVHIAGYHQYDNNSHAEHWHISNTGLKPDGSYSPAQDEFHFSNDFNTRTVIDHRQILRSFDANPLNHQF